MWRFAERRLATLVSLSQPLTVLTHPSAACAAWVVRGGGVPRVGILSSGLRLAFWRFSMHSRIFLSVTVTCFGLSAAACSSSPNSPGFGGTGTSGSSGTSGTKSGSSGTSGTKSGSSGTAGASTGSTTGTASGTKSGSTGTTGTTGSTTGASGTSTGTAGSQTGASGTSSAAPPPAGPPAGPYTVSGANILDKNGHKHLFRGLDRPSLEWSCSGDIKDDEYQIMQSWGANVVRVALNQDCWLNDPSNTLYDSQYESTVDEQVQDAVNAGLDIILDLH